MSGEHSVLPPSGAKAWKLCPMWVTMNQRFPKEDTPESLEGNAAHWVAWEMLAGRPVSEGIATPNGVIVTEEMLEGAELLCDTIAERVHNGMHDFHIVERRVDIPSIHPKCFGTPDVRFFSRNIMALDIVDYKFGHRFVDEYANDQLACYFSGILDELAEELGIGAGIVDQTLIVSFTIVQPRCYVGGSPVRTWTVPAHELRGQVNQLKHAAELSLQPDPVAITNSECRDCPGRHACPALQKAAYSDAEFSTRSTPLELPIGAASLELRIMERALERLQARVDGMGEYITNCLRQGQVAPYHHTEQGYGRQTWALPVEQIIAMGELFGVDVSKPSVKTPGQVLKLGIDETVINAYSVKPLGKIKLVSDNPADARRVFGKS